MTAQQTARFLLREATSDLHEALDALLSRTDFHDRASYTDFLTRQAAPLFAIEGAIEASVLADELGDWPTRRRSAAIGEDLARLGVASPPPSSPLRITRPDELIGALYVLEGSRLGAKFLVRAARESRDSTVREATAYLGHGEGETLWPTFLTLLAKREKAGLDHAALVEGARGAFTLFLDAARRDHPDDALPMSA